MNLTSVEDLVFCRLQAFLVFDDQLRKAALIFGRPLSSLTSRLVSVSGLLDTPEIFLAYLHVGLDCELLSLMAL